jgi:hypothetical protein
MTLTVTSGSSISEKVYYIGKALPAKPPKTATVALIPWVGETTKLIVHISSHVA